MNIQEMQNRDTTLKRIFVITNFVVEIPSAVFDQLSSVRKPQFALISMIMSFAIVLISVIDLAHMGRRKAVKWMSRDGICWFYSTYLNYKPLGSFTDIVGLVCGIFQCVFATISFAFLSQKADNPIKISIWPLIFAFGVLCSRFGRSNLCKISVLKRVEIHPNSPSQATLHGQQPPETPLIIDNRNNDRDRDRVLAEMAEQARKRADILRFYYAQTSTRAACLIQAAWRCYYRRKQAKSLHQADEKLKDVLVNEAAISPSLSALIYASQFAANALRYPRQNNGSGRTLRLPLRLAWVPLRPTDEPHFSVS